MIIKNEKEFTKDLGRLLGTVAFSQDEVLFQNTKDVLRHIDGLDEKLIKIGAKEQLERFDLNKHEISDYLDDIEESFNLDFKNEEDINLNEENEIEAFSKEMTKSFTKSGDKDEAFWSIIDSATSNASNFGFCYEAVDVSYLDIYGYKDVLTHNDMPELAFSVDNEFEFIVINLLRWTSNLEQLYEDAKSIINGSKTDFLSMIGGYPIKVALARNTLEEDYEIFVSFHMEEK